MRFLVIREIRITSGPHTELHESTKFKIKPSIMWVLTQWITIIFVLIFIKKVKYSFSIFCFLPLRRFIIKSQHRHRCRHHLCYQLCYQLKLVTLLRLVEKLTQVMDATKNRNTAYTSLLMLSDQRQLVLSIPFKRFIFIIL